MDEEEVILMTGTVGEELTGSHHHHHHRHPTPASEELLNAKCLKTFVSFLSPSVFVIPTKFPVCFRVDFPISCLDDATSCPLRLCPGTPPWRTPHRKPELFHRHVDHNV